MIFRKKLYIKDMDVKQNRTRRILALIAPLAIGFSLCACGTEVAGGGLFLESIHITFKILLEIREF